MSNRQTPSNDEMEIAEAKNPLADLLYDYTAQAMTTRAGNYMYHRIDACLAVVEKTAKWSLPQSPPPSEEDTTKMNISPPPLIRPLPWILFLPALIALRLVRVSLSFIALLIGKQPVYPVTMVSFLQSRRRKLRALKYRGQKIQRMKRAELESEQGHEQAAKTWLDRITFPLRYIICLRAVRPGTSTNQREHHHHHHHHQRQSRDANNEVANDGDESSRANPRDETARRGKRNVHERDADDSGSSFDASVQELLEKYANEDGDSSYHMSDSASSSETDSFISGSDISATETTDVAKENDSKKAKKESNGHVTPPEKKPGVSQKPPQPKKRSSLNAVNNDKSEENSKPSATAEAAASNGKVEPKDEPKEESHTAATQKPMKTTSDAAENNDNKPATQNNSAKADSSEDSTKPEIQNSKNPSPTTTKEVKNNPQQKNMQQQQQQQPNQKSQQNPHQQQQTATVNGGGGGGKKHKKPHHQHSQQNQHQLHQQQQQQQQHQQQQQY